MGYVGGVLLDFWKKHRRAEIRERPFPASYADIIARNVPYVARLSPDDRRELEGLALVFLDEKPFEGCGGLEVDDEIRVTIAAQACVLLLHRDTDMYPNLDVVLVYPSAYRAQARRRDGAVVIDEEGVRLGESWTQGTVVLAWDSVKRGATHMFDGHNVVFHEFAHQLDAEDGSMDGAPDLETGARYSAWAKVLGDEYEELTRRLASGRGSDIDAYGATNAQEFFAVVTEIFFERPHALKKRHPDLYAELAGFFRQDPAER